MHLHAQPIFVFVWELGRRIILCFAGRENGFVFNHNIVTPRVFGKSCHKKIPYTIQSHSDSVYFVRAITTNNHYKSKTRSVRKKRWEKAQLSVFCAYDISSPTKLFFPCEKGSTRENRSPLLYISTMRVSFSCSVTIY